MAGGGARLDGTVVTDEAQHITLATDEMRISAGKKKHGILRRA